MENKYSLLAVEAVKKGLNSEIAARLSIEAEATIGPWLKGEERQNALRRRAEARKELERVAAEGMTLERATQVLGWSPSVEGGEEMKIQDCCKIIKEIAESLVDSVWAAENDGFHSDESAKALISQIESIFVVCGFKPTWPVVSEPPLYLDIDGKKHKLIGEEKSEDKAEDWAANMRHHGEKIVIRKFINGFAVYREE